MTQNRVLVIAGMHRSGTSLLSGWLSSCGLFLGERLMGSSHGNIKGHYEDLDFHDFHEQVFQRAGIPSGGFSQLEKLAYTKAEIKQLQSICAKKCRQHQQWGFKDPRTTLFLPLYQQLLPEARYLAVFRPYQSVVDSLIRREWKDKLQSVAQNGSTMKRLKFRLFQKKKLRAFKEKYSNLFLQAWIVYNQHILDLVKNADDSAILVKSSSIPDKSQELLAVLEAWGFDLKPTPIDEFYESNLMQKEPAVLELNADLEHRAIQLEQALEKLAI